MQRPLDPGPRVVGLHDGPLVVHDQGRCVGRREPSPQVLDRSVLTYPPTVSDKRDVVTGRDRRELVEIQHPAIENGAITRGAWMEPNSDSCWTILRVNDDVMLCVHVGETGCSGFGVVHDSECAFPVETQLASFDGPTHRPLARLPSDRVDHHVT